MTGVVLTPEEVLARIPQAPPFRFVDRIVSIDATHAVGEVRFREDEAFYRGHFPGDPITPGVILLEAMCQTGVVALGLFLAALERPGGAGDNVVTLFTEATNVEFDRVVRPGELLRIRAERVYWRRRKLRSRVELTLEDHTPVARATVAGVGVGRGEA